MSANLSIRNCKFAYLCSTKWDDLQVTDDDDVRFCNACQKEVYFCYDDYELVSGIHLNRCIAFDQKSID